MRIMIFLSLFVGYKAFADDIFPAGKLKAVLAGPVQEGKSFENSLGNLEVKGKSILLSQPKSNFCKEPYITRYDASYIMTKDEKEKSPLKDIPADCTILKQHEKSNLAQAFFCKNKETGAVDMTLGEGMPMLIEKFRPVSHEDKLMQDYNDARKVYWTGKAPSLPGESDDAIVPVDLVKAEKILSGNNTQEKVEILKEIESAIWVARPETVEKRFKLIAMASKDKDPKVQLEALHVFQYDGRVTNGIPMLAEMVENLSKYNPEVQKMIAESVGYLYSQGYRTAKNNLSLIKKYKSFTAKEILAAADGVIDAQDVDSFEEICRAETMKVNTTFSLEQTKGLQELLIKISRNKSIDRSAGIKAISFLNDYNLTQVSEDYARLNKAKVIENSTI